MPELLTPEARAFLDAWKGGPSWNRQMQEDLQPVLAAERRRALLEAAGRLDDTASRQPREFPIDRAVSAALLDEAAALRERAGREGG